MLFCLFAFRLDGGYDRYYLTKADTVSNSKELMKLMVQITQNIKEHINNQHGLEIPTFWLPTAGGGDRRSGGIDDGLDNDVNQLEEVCETITMAIHQKVQDNLSHVQHDCQQITDKARELLAKDDFERAARRSRELVALVIAACAWAIPLLAFIALIVRVGGAFPKPVCVPDVIT
ncbi:hypothetical protein BBJ28_00001570 [Nothophytophthora sp. Chile5]|nr:hypothetical protein BBJ28_00001570 [Nothophytophthora sp. Chile5]